MVKIIKKRAKKFFKKNKKYPEWQLYMWPTYKEMDMQFNSNTGNYYSLEKPLQEIMALNMRTFENLSYTHPADLLSAQNPEELLEKNMDVFVQNALQLLDYWQDACNIMEKCWLIVSYDILEQNHQVMQQPSLFNLDKVGKGSARPTGANERKKMIRASHITVDEVQKNLNENPREDRDLIKHRRDPLLRGNGSEKAERKNF